MNETRLYKSWGEEDGKEISAVSFGNGILRAKRALNDFHKDLSRQGFDQVTRSVIIITISTMFFNHNASQRQTKFHEYMQQSCCEHGFGDSTALKHDKGFKQMSI